MKKFYTCRYDRTFKEVFLNPKKVKIEIEKLLENK